MFHGVYAVVGSGVGDTQDPFGRSPSPASGRYVSKLSWSVYLFASEDGHNDEILFRLLTGVDCLME